MTQDPFYEGLPEEPAAVEPPRTCAPGEHVEPVELTLTRECEWKRKPCGTCGRPKSNPVHRVKGGTCKFKRQLGCARCGRKKADAAHYGAPESFNISAGRDPNVYRSSIEAWKEVLKPLVYASGLPRGLGRVLAEGQCSFGDAKDRDQGNHRVIVEKALGDLLVEEGFLPADTWGHYEFGGLQREEEAGVSRLRLMLFPEAPAVPESDPQASLLG